MIAECEVLMLVSLQSYTLLHFKRKQLLRWNVCQLSEDRNIRNIPSVTKGETHTNRLSFRLNKHKVSYFHVSISAADAVPGGSREGRRGSHIPRGSPPMLRGGETRTPTCQHPAGDAFGLSRNATAASEQQELWRPLLPASTFSLSHPRGVRGA